MGSDLRPHIKSGLVRITQLDPAEVSPGQFIGLVRSAVERDGARIIVIDSLNGFLNAMSGEQMLVSHMHELLTFLNQRGVVTLVVLTLSGMIGTQISVPIDLTYLADNVLVLRFFEARGRLRKALSVVKKRSGKHEDTIHDLRFPPTGLSLSSPLSDFRGIMSGIPTDGGSSTLGEAPVSPTKAEQVLVHAPFGRDAAMICQFLGHSGISAGVCRTVEEVCAQLGDHTGAVLISDESLTAANISALAAVLNAQPPWSDLPVIVTTSGGAATAASRKRLDILGRLGNFSLLERPLRTVTLVSAMQSALRARRRQYQLREHVAERDRLVQELKRSNEELTQFAHVVSHDLQAPVRMVNSFSELLARRYRGQLDKTAEEFIGAIQDGAAAMEALIRTLLAYAKVGKGPVKRTRVGLASVVDAVVTTLQPTIEELQADVSYGDLPDVQGDRVLLQQLVQNLVGNALKYVGETAPRVNISAHDTEREWVVSVTDNGPGIAPEHHETIFLPLKRLHGSEISGTGMGLAVCRKIAERHGGRIWLESRPGIGCRFFFTLPRMEREQKLDAGDSVTSKQSPS